MKTAITEANQEVARLKKDKENLTDEVGSLKAKKGELEAYLGQLAEKLVLKLEGISFSSTDLLISTVTPCKTVDSLLFQLCRTLSGF